MRARMRQDCEVLSITVLKGQDGPNEFGRHARMKRLLTLLSALALFGAFAIGATVVRADDQGSDDNAQCQSGTTSGDDNGGGGGDDRSAKTASHDGGTQGDDN